MRITFVLPSPVRTPIGGAKVVYAHARGLAARGHEVVVVEPRRQGGGMRDLFRDGAIRLMDRLHRVGEGPYYTAPGVETIRVPDVRAGVVPDADVVIATGCQTAPWVNRLPPEKGRPVYFIQGYETFIRKDASASWHLPMARITCATWLRRAIEAAGEVVLGVVPNAVDPGEFFLEAPSFGRTASVLMHYHRHPVKGPREGAAVLARLAARLPALRVDVFSARPPLHRLPRGVQVHIRPGIPALRALYNRSAVLLHTSRSEGWGLVPMEAAACGCAVAGFGNEGVREYLVDGQSARLVPVGDVEKLADAAAALLTDEHERVRLAEAARRHVVTFSWEESTARFEGLLQQALR